jgi:ABC-type branched-subunit amino acid transport system ATPase component
MYERIRINRFRQFQTFELAGLTRVNLLVGKNNAGKTSLLEAIEMLASGGRASALLLSARRRGEDLLVPNEARHIRQLDVRHLFLGHKLEVGLSFELIGRSGNVETLVRCDVEHAPLDLSRRELVPEDLDLESQLALRLRGPETPEGVLLPVSAQGTVLADPVRRVRPVAPHVASPVVFLGTEGAPADSLQQNWNNLVLTSEEEKVTAAMKIVEPNMERLAFTTRDMSGPGTAFVKFVGEDQRVPLGSLGDGTRRLLALAILLARATGGVLLVDEIDTGLHYTALESMWRFVVETARRLDIQVFATSHSGDCVRALAWLQSDAPDLASEVSVHRVERGADAAVLYSAADIETAARHHIEVRG